MSGVVKKINIDKILNFYENPRHEIGTSEKDTLKKLFDSVGKQHMLNLAEDICLNGLMGGQQITVVFETSMNKYIVYEGNRRVAAIKLLLRPDYFDFLDKPSIDRIKKLNVDPDALKQLDCYVTDKEEAYFIMERRHSGEDKGRGVRPWSPREKEAFLSRKSDRKSLSYLIDYYIKKHFNGFDITTIITFTTVQRIFNNRAVRASIGLDPNDENSFTIERMQLIIDASKWVVEEAEKNGLAITRMFNKAKIIEDKLLPWIIAYKTDLQHTNFQSSPHTTSSTDNDTTNGTSTSSNGNDHQNTISNNPTSSPNNTADNSPTSSTNPSFSAGNSNNVPYFFQGIDYRHLDPNDADSHGISTVCHEIRKFSDKRLVRDFCLSAAFLTRAIIEQSLIYYAKKHNIQGQAKTIYSKIPENAKLSVIIKNYKINLPNYIPDSSMRQYFMSLFDDYEKHTDPLNWVIHRPSEYQLGEQALLDLPRKGLLSLINYLIS